MDVGLTNIEISPQWERLDLEGLHGVLMIAGGIDVGKSTFARYLYQRLRLSGLRTALLDGDPGQTFLGPPTTLTLAVETGDTTLPLQIASFPGSIFPPNIHLLSCFAGSTSPRGHMLSVVSSSVRLAQAAFRLDAQAVVHDTSGLIAPEGGGLALKLAKIELERPSAVFAIQKAQELEPLLAPLRRSRRTRLFELPPSPAAVPRTRAQRLMHRSEQYAAYFKGSTSIDVDWTGLAVFPQPRFLPHQLLAFEDVHGYVLGLGIIREIQPRSHLISLLTPLASLDQVDSLEVGDVLLDPETFIDKLL